MSIILITNISEKFKKLLIFNISDSDNIIIIIIKELIIEIRIYYKIYIIVINSFLFLLNLILIIFLIELYYF